MGEKKFHSAKRKRMINNTIVHIVLAVLAAIWIFPIIWVVLTSFRAEKVLMYPPSSHSPLHWITIQDYLQILRF